MIPITFNSFGDIVTAADLAIRISKALSSSMGSTYEYQYLIQELNALAYALQLADAATRTGMLQRDAVNGIVAEIARCREVMDALWERIRGYQKALGSGKRGSSSTGSSWRKIGWALFKTQDVQETRMKLSNHRMTLITLMTACNLENIEELKSQCTRFERSVHIRLDEIYTAVCQLPQKMGYTEANGLSIIDWRGVESMIPLDLCRSKDQFLATLNSVFYNWPFFARKYVQSANGLLICDKKRSYLDRNNEGSFLKNLVAGASIRVTGLHTNNLKQEWVSRVRSLPYNMCVQYCSECESGGRSDPLSAFYAYCHEISTIHLGCDSELATWKVTVEETYDLEDGRYTHWYTFHDHRYARCPLSDVGVPITLLNWAGEEEDEQRLGFAEGPIRILRDNAFPYTIV